jgi:hypothetical protein
MREVRSNDGNGATGTEADVAVDAGHVLISESSSKLPLGLHCEALATDRRAGSGCRQVPGSDMSASPLLTPQEIQAVTYYMRSLYLCPVGDASQPLVAKSTSLEDMP